jgi:hypothetical protein
MSLSPCALFPKISKSPRVTPSIQVHTFFVLASPTETSNTTVYRRSKKIPNQIRLHAKIETTTYLGVRELSGFKLGH